jgi:putative tryptophan/tyrosine transport system substrate-binding protein
MPILSLVAVLLLGLLLLVLGCAREAPGMGSTSADEDAAAPTAAPTTGAVPREAVPLVGVIQIVSHPALDTVVAGVREGLAEAGYREGQTVEYSLVNAEGDAGRAGELGRELADRGADVLIAVSTAAAAAVAREVANVPVVFGAVPAPAAARLPGEPVGARRNVTGVLDLPPVEAHLDLVAKIAPTATRLGLLYDTGDPVSVGLAHREAAAAREMGFKVVQTGASQPAGSLAAAQALAGRVDVISIYTGSPILSALESVLAVANENQIPVVSNDLDSVRRGAVAAYSVGYEEHGRQVGVLAARVLDGASPADLPIEAPGSLELSLNPAAADRIGLPVPDDLRAQADHIF